MHVTKTLTRNYFDDAPLLVLYNHSLLILDYDSAYQKEEYIEPNDVYDIDFLWSQKFDTSTDEVIEV